MSEQLKLPLTRKSPRSPAVCSKCGGPRMPATSGRLTAQLVRDIRCLYTYGAMTKRQLCERFGVCQATMNLILANKTWQEADYTPITRQQFVALHKTFKQRIA